MTRAEAIEAYRQVMHDFADAYCEHLNDMLEPDEGQYKDNKGLQYWQILISVLDDLDDHVDAIAGIMAHNPRYAVPPEVLEMWQRLSDQRPLTDVTDAIDSQVGPSQ